MPVPARAAWRGLRHVWGRRGVSGDAKRALRLAGRALEDGHACIATPCPMCNNAKHHLYINKTTGFFLCPSCDASGQWETLEKIIKSPKSPSLAAEIAEAMSSTKDSFGATWNGLVDSSTSFSNMSEEQIRNTLEKFKLAIPPDPSKLLAEVRLSSDNNSLYFPLQNLASKTVGYINYCEDGAFTIPKENCRGILWFKTIRTYSKDHPTVVVPDVKDAVAVASQRSQGSVVCLPYGFNNIPQEILPNLERIPKLVLWSGPDGARNVPAVARKLGESRCLLIRPTDAQPSAYEAWERKLDFKSIISTAHPVWHKSITTFKSLRQDVLSDLHNNEKIKGIKWKRFPTLNRLLLGHRRGELTVLTGPTGCGKTTFCSEYSLDLTLQGVNTLWGSFEIRNARLVRTMLQQLAGFPLEEKLDLYDKYADVFEKLPIYFLMFYGQQSIKDVMEAVEHATYVYDIAHVIIDNVQFMLGVGDEPSKHTERFWKQDAIVSSFRTFATRTNCHVTLVMHPRKERDVDDLSTSSIFGSAKASQEADNVLIIQDKRLTTVRGKKYLQVAKNRYSGDLGIMPMEFDKSALSYAQQKKKPTTAKDNEGTKEVQ